MPRLPIGGMHARFVSACTPLSSSSLSSSSASPSSASRVGSSLQYVSAQTGTPKTRRVRLEQSLAVDNLIVSAQREAMSWSAKQTGKNCSGNDLLEFPLRYSTDTVAKCKAACERMKPSCCKGIVMDRGPNNANFDGEGNKRRCWLKGACRDDRITTKPERVLWKRS